MRGLALLTLGLSVAACAPRYQTLGDPAPDYARCEGALVVMVENIQSDAGQVRAALFTADGWAQNISEDEVSAPASARQITFADPPRTDMAIKLFHDIDGDGDLSVKGIIPTEPYGFSNDARAFFGPPKWDAVRVDNAGCVEALTVTLQAPPGVKQ